MDKVFPLLAIMGLFLAGWGLMITPEEIREGKELVTLKWSRATPVQQTYVP